MILYPAIDIYEGKVVRLKRGDYEQMTIYSNDPVSTALSFKESGATALHIVDLEGARDGKPANFEIIKQIASETNLFVQVGGGIRTSETIEKYLKAGIRRLILGTAAVSIPGFLQDMVNEFDEAIAVSADIKDGLVAIKGWTEVSDLDVFDFCDTVENFGVKTLICTDISKDGMQSGTNVGLYRLLRERLFIEIIASGGVSTINEIKILSEIKINGTILGKSLYTGKINLSEAITLCL
jgi:phosphoribosylformimino-5-aminoimidazole carboxamide ribotide isomerase